jgi:hypothetical protein
VDIYIERRGRRREGIAHHEKEIAKGIMCVTIIRAEGGNPLTLTPYFRWTLPLRRRRRTRDMRKESDEYT